MSYYRNQLERYLKELEIECYHVIDIGGSANPVRSRVKKWNVDKYTIIDNLSEKRFNHVKWRKPDIKFDLNSSGETPMIQAPIVFCLEVMEYVYDPVTALLHIQSMIDDKGVLYITFPTLYPLHEPTDIDYLRYSRASIERLMHVVELKIVEIVPRVTGQVAHKSLARFWTVDGMHPAKGTDEIYHTGYIVKATTT